MHSNKQDTSLFNMRKEYAHESAGLDPSILGNDPLSITRDWLQIATQAEVPEPNAALLSTVDAAHKPHTRAVLIKAIEPTSLLFFTNYTSQKAQQISENPHVSLVFLWLPIAKQIRIQGTATQTPQAINEQYFATRPRDSQLAAWCSPQSQTLSPQALHEKYQAITQQFEKKNVPCPPHWGGYRIHPTCIEFWQGQANRLHDRLIYTYQANQWETQWLAP